MPSQKKFPTLIFLLTILLVGAVVFGAYFYLQVRTMTLDKIAPSPTPAPIASSDPTADWHIYTNNESGYSIKYPNNMVRLICPKEELNLVNKEEGDTRLEPVEMSSCARDGRYTLETKTYSSPQDPPEQSKYYKIEEKTITLGGITGKQYTLTYTNIGAGPYPEWYTFVKVEKDKKTYEIYFSSKDQLVTFDQILSTFKFTDTKNSCTPSYTVESNMGELTAAQNYAQECLSKTTEESCLKVDNYNKQADNFSTPDNIPDCVWSD